MQEPAQILSFFLRAHAWKLFALQFILPIVCLVLGGVIGVKAIFPVVFIVTTVIWGGVPYLWMVAVARASNRVVHFEKRRSTHLMEVGLAFSVIYVVVAMSLMQADLDLKAKLIPHFLAMFATIYAMWFAANRLSTATNKQRSSAGTSGRFFLIWLFPLGIWFLQPDVRRGLGGVPA